METFTLTRSLDGLIYRSKSDAEGARCYRRVDRPDLTLEWEVTLGCIMRDPEGDALVGFTWNVPVPQQEGRPAELCLRCVA